MESELVWTIDNHSIIYRYGHAPLVFELSRSQNVCGGQNQYIPDASGDIITSHSPSYNYIFLNADSGLECLSRFLFHTLIKNTVLLTLRWTWNDNYNMYLVFPVLRIGFKIDIGLIGHLTTGQNLKDSPTVTY